VLSPYEMIVPKHCKVSSPVIQSDLRVKTALFMPFIDHLLRLCYPFPEIDWQYGFSEDFQV